MNAATGARGGAVVAALLLMGGLGPAGCTRESVRTAIETQRRADQVQAAVVEQQHAALRVLLYRDLVRRLEAGGAALSAEQRAALSEVWNDRDLVEFWMLQAERGRTLRLVGVDAALFGQQSIVDLLYRAVERKLERAQAGLRGALAEAAAVERGLGDGGVRD